ncbi:MAG: phosphoribosylglycinamide formyltransferase, partial [Clostridia bacterium]|nr:phosphoribosylglycinamide formyltransferase [Clostridia bacterium]
MVEKPVRIAVLVSGGGTNLQALIDANLQNGKIALVVSSKSGVYALERAAKAGIASAVIERRNSTQEAFEEKLEALLAQYEIELIILPGFLTILSPDFTARHP